MDFPELTPHGPRWNCCCFIGTGDILQATVDIVTKMLSTTIKDTGKVGTSVTDAIADVASGAIRGKPISHLVKDIGEFTIHQ
jgi:hypothetical protein